MNTHYIELPPLPDPEIDDAGAFMSDAQVMTIESAKEYARVAVEHDRQQRGEVVVTWDETQTRIVAVTRQDEVGKILSVIAQANCQRSAEPVGVIREPDQPGEEPWAEIWADLPVGTSLYTAPQPTETVKWPSFNDIVGLGVLNGVIRADLESGKFVPVGGADIDMRGALEAFSRALLAQYGHPVEPEGWQLVPKEPTEEMMFMGVSEWATHDDSEEDVYGVWEAMLSAAPKFGEEE